VEAKAKEGRNVTPFFAPAVTEARPWDSNFTIKIDGKVEHRRIEYISLPLFTVRSASIINNNIITNTLAGPNFLICFH
jgi:hypothetical protein